MHHSTKIVSDIFFSITEIKKKIQHVNAMGLLPEDWLADDLD